MKKAFNIYDIAVLVGYAWYHGKHGDRDSIDLYNFVNLFLDEDDKEEFWSSYHMLIKKFKKANEMK